MQKGKQRDSWVPEENSTQHSDQMRGRPLCDVGGFAPGFRAPGTSQTPQPSRATEAGGRGCRGASRATAPLPAHVTAQPPCRQSPGGRVSMKPPDADKQQCPCSV